MEDEKQVVYELEFPKYYLKTSSNRGNTGELLGLFCDPKNGDDCLSLPWFKVFEAPKDSGFSGSWDLWYDHSWCLGGINNILVAEGVPIRLFNFGGATGLGFDLLHDLTITYLSDIRYSFWTNTGSSIAWVKWGTVKVYHTSILFLMAVHVCFIDFCDYVVIT